MSLIQFFTFGTKYVRRHRPEADLYVDCTRLPNPPFYEQTGQSRQVQRWLQNEISRGESRKYYDKLAIRVLQESLEASRTAVQLNVGFYCYGGRHRSVFVSESIAEKLKMVGVEVEIKHLELNRPRPKFITIIGSHT
jgi:UPF0042 nucleotide-binding protein